MTRPCDIDVAAGTTRGPRVATRLLVNAALLMALSPGAVFLGWGFTLGIVAGWVIAASVRWVNRAPDSYQVRKGERV